MVESLPAGAGDSGSIPDPGRSHMPRGSQAQARELLSLRSRAQEPKLLKPLSPGGHAPQQEKPLQWEACALQLESSPPLTPTREKPVQQ